MKRSTIFFALSLLTPILLIGCSLDREITSNSSESSQSLRKFQSIRIEVLPSHIPMSAKRKKEFEDYLARCLYKEAKFHKGNELTLKYKFSRPPSLEQGIMSGMGNEGRDQLIVDVVYIDISGNEIGRMRSESRINGVLQGKAFTTALQTTAEKIATHAKSHFKADPKS